MVRDIHFPLVLCYWEPLVCILFILLHNTFSILYLSVSFIILSKYENILELKILWHTQLAKMLYFVDHAWCSIPNKQKQGRLIDGYCWMLVTLFWVISHSFGSNFPCVFLMYSILKVFMCVFNVFTIKRFISMI